MGTRRDPGSQEVMPPGGATHFVQLAGVSVGFSWEVASGQRFCEGKRRCGPHAACWEPRRPVQPLGLRPGPGLRQAPLWALRTNWGEGGPSALGPQQVATLAVGAERVLSRLTACSIAVLAWPSLSPACPPLVPGCHSSSQDTKADALSVTSLVCPAQGQRGTGKVLQDTVGQTRPEEARCGCSLSSWRSSGGAWPGPAHAGLASFRSTAGWPAWPCQSSRWGLSGPLQGDVKPTSGLGGKPTLDSFLVSPVSFLLH